MWVVFIGGTNSKGILTLVQMALTADPEKHLAALASNSPYVLSMLGSEHGDLEQFEARKHQFRQFALRNGWFAARPELTDFIASLPPHDPKQGADVKLALNLTPLEFQALEDAVEIMDLKTKARLVRRAIKFYIALGKYKAKGWTVQVIKGGKFKDFPDLDDIKDPE